MAFSKDDFQPPYTGGPTPGKRLLLTPGEFEVLDYDESLLTPPDTVSTARADNYHRVVVYSWLGRDLEGLSRKLSRQCYGLSQPVSGSDRW